MAIATLKLNKELLPDHLELYWSGFELLFDKKNVILIVVNWFYVFVTNWNWIVIDFHFISAEITRYKKSKDRRRDGQSKIKLHLNFSENEQRKKGKYYFLPILPKRSPDKFYHLAQNVERYEMEVLVIKTMKMISLWIPFVETE